ncbi:ADP-ribosylglycohydrolase family protein [Desulfonema limicola]|uniref:ADP-ribosylglycohydrolase family protein n=1 Tax=Desulfonema limicola TaxID=45656 RepID=A0A975BAI3_9BACT|nr:ADP-ribosylglycohydrolase family protein [Desulfonema limicola]QTA81590.1 ADP-ribosylglycohydrolase family protein [Desulfonema limicola]
MVLASFAADSLSLGAHWIYDVQKITDTYGRIESLIKPGPDSYHNTKNAGEFTHYGDQTYILLQSLAAEKAFDLNDFSSRWQKMFENYNGYIDGATSKTLAYYAKGRSPEKAGSHTGDFGGPARIAPLVYLYSDDIETLVESVRTQTAMTHNDPNTLDTAEFFARAVVLVLNGSSPVEALKQTAASHFDMSPISMWVSDGIKSKDQDTISVISGFGQACSTSLVFPGVIHLIARYENDLKEALIQSIMAGGESAARGAVTGMILGAYLGIEQLPQEWTAGMKKISEIKKLLDSLIEDLN